ncbi:unnamed protein product [Arabis nemorensis]|uniref:Uncharacterized protein n=1 Tax=Arabis nemorensis TaxID=586526 RepID=A0A565C5G5_9BRAS|nr:unnamed protein product [Arabis nemorensis]
MAVEQPLLAPLPPPEATISHTDNTEEQHDNAPLLSPDKQAHHAEGRPITAPLPDHEAQVPPPEISPPADAHSSVENSEDMEIDPASDLRGLFPYVQEQTHVDKNVQAEHSRLEDKLVDTDDESGDAEYGCDKHIKTTNFVAAGHSNKLSTNLFQI